MSRSGQGMTEIVKAALLDNLWASYGSEVDLSPFALIDAARNPTIYPTLLEADCAWCSLYRGESVHRLADSAPYLVQLDWQSRFTLWLLEEGWRESWGVFLTSCASLTALRQHFRRLLMVEIPDGRIVYFRFYDPRVLRTFLPTCLPVELDGVFGPVDRFLVEDEEGTAALIFSHNGKHLDQARILLQ